MKCSREMLLPEKMRLWERFESGRGGRISDTVGQFAPVTGTLKRKIFYRCAWEQETL